MDTKMNDRTKSLRNLAAGLMAGMESEDSTLEDRFRKAEVLLGGSTSNTTHPMPTGRHAPGPRAERITFSMTKQDVLLIEDQLLRITLETGMRLNKSELVRLGIMGLTKFTPEQLTDLCLSLNRLNKRG